MSPELSAALFEWNRVWQEHDELGPVPEGWEARGSELCEVLQVELDGIAEVTPPSFYEDELLGPYSELQV